MREGGRADLALVGLVGSIGDEADAEFTFGRFDRGVDLASRNAVPFGVKLEVLDRRLHRALHFAAARRNNLATGVDDPFFSRSEPRTLQQGLFAPKPTKPLHLTPPPH